MSQETSVIQTFTHEQFGEIRTVEIDGEIWFVAADVCRALELSNPTVAVAGLPEDNRAKFNLGRSQIHGGGGETNCINEPGLYRLVFKSRKPEAEKFQDWVYREVLPSIRKTGEYKTDDTKVDYTKVDALLKTVSKSKDVAFREMLLHEVACILTGKKFSADEKSKSRIEPRLYDFNRKLTDEQAEEIRLLYFQGNSLRKLAEMFGVSHMTIRRVIKYITYR